jgi:two-component system response regulator RegA
MTPEEVRTLLLVDDEPVFLERLARAFEARGFAVRQAHNYEEAVAAAKDDPPEFAVVDRCRGDAARSRRLPLEAREHR